MEKKILVVGAMYSLNFGDGVICQTVNQIIQNELQAKPEIFGISGSADFPQNGTSKGQQREKRLKSAVLRLCVVKHLRLQRNKIRMWSKLDRKALDCTAIVFAGGQLFMDCFVNYISWIVMWAQHHKIPVVFNCCGVGKLSEKEQKILARALTAPCVKDITIRESTDLFYQQLPRKIPAEQIWDPAMEAAKYYRPSGKGCVKMGIGLIHPANFRANCVHIDTEQYLEILRIVVALCSEQGVDFEFFINGDPLDAVFCCEAAAELGCQDKVAAFPQMPEQLIETVTRYEKIFSFRLHSHIIATSYGIPTAAFVWDEKVREFMQAIGRKQRCISLMKMPDREEMEQVFSQLLEDVAVCPDCGLEFSSQRLKKML